MPEQNKNIGISFNNLPSILIEGRDWQHRTGGKAFLDKVKEFQKFRVKNENSESAQAEIMSMVKELITSLFLKGDELFVEADKVFDSDVERWFTFIVDVAEQIQKARLEKMQAGIAKFKTNEVESAPKGV